MEEHDTRPLIAITMGDPAGIGAEVSLKALLAPEVYTICRPLVLGTLGMLEQMRDVLHSGQYLQSVSSPAEGRYTPGTVDVLDLADEHPGPFLLGVAAKENGAAAVAYVERAIALALTGEVDAIATAPLNKEAMRAAGFPYDGHTELLAVKTGTKVYTMMLASGDFRVFHVSTHVSLRGAIERAKKARVLQVIELAYREIQRMGVTEPRLAVAGLNPHAGEHGLFDDLMVHLRRSGGCNTEGATNRAGGLDVDRGELGDVQRKELLGKFPSRTACLAWWMLGSTAKVEAAASAFALAKVRFVLSASSIHVGAWSLAFSQPRTWRSTPAVFRRRAVEGLSSR